jgi:Zn-finger nucleic acid-binding protein
MQSPRDRQSTLVRTELADGLPAHVCPTSGGVWIDVALYWDWFRKQPGFPKPSPSFESLNPIEIEDDIDTPMISPSSGRIMRKCRVGSGLGFRIDFDPASGFWLDKGEYDSLLAHNLHDELHLICSPEYQLALVRLQSKQSEQDRFARALGEDACDRIAQFAGWFGGLRDRSIAMSYLMVCIEDRDERT